MPDKTTLTNKKKREREREQDRQSEKNLQNFTRKRKRDKIKVKKKKKQFFTRLRFQFTLLTFLLWHFQRDKYKRVCLYRLAAALPSSFECDTYDGCFAWVSCSPRASLGISRTNVFVSSIYSQAFVQFDWTRVHASPSCIYMLVYQSDEKKDGVVTMGLLPTNNAYKLRPILRAV